MNTHSTWAKEKVQKSAKVWVKQGSSPQGPLYANVFE